MEEMRADAWFYVGPHDIFPEQFVNFLGFPNEAKAAFLKYHTDLLNAEYWNELKRRLESGEVIDVVPYSARLWTGHHGHSLYPTDVHDAETKSD